MPRPRTPKAKAEVSGAAAKNAARFKDRKAPKSSRALGEPYVNMTVEQKAAWAEIQYEMPWLTSSDRIMVRLACSWMARIGYGGYPANQGAPGQDTAPPRGFLSPRNIEFADVGASTEGDDGNLCNRLRGPALHGADGRGDAAESGHAATDTAPPVFLF